MKNVTLVKRLILLLAIPLLGLACFALIRAAEKWQERRSYQALAHDARVLKGIGDLVHELQSERGRSAVFIGTRGARFAAETGGQRRATDAARSALGEALGAFDVAARGADFQRTFSGALTALEALPARRSTADAFTITAAESTAFYTQAIAALLASASELSRQVPDITVARGISSYVSYLEAKEQAGVERAVLAGVFSADRFAGDAYLRFTQAVAKQETYLHVFESFATAAQRQFYAETLRSAIVEKVAAMRQTALDRAAAGGFGVDSSVWFEAVTEKIGLLKRVEDRLAADYQAHTAQACSAIERSFGFTLTLAASLTLVTLGFGVWVIRSITGNLRVTIGDLTAASEQTARAAAQVSNSSQSLAQGASEQAASLEETAASLEEISSMTKRNAESAARANTLAGEARRAADASTGDITQMTEAMSDIRSSSHEIAKIVKTIDEIAFQTNILALNAAVEAARAGEAGAGFAVVAEEVRALAQRSAGAAKETAERIEAAISKSERGVKFTNTVASGLDEIVRKVREVDGLIAEIATASGEQERGILEVNQAVGQMDRLTQSNAANAEESAAAAEELNAQAESLGDSVRQLEKLAGASAGRSSSSGGPAKIAPAPQLRSAASARKPAPVAAPHAGAAR